MVSATAGPVPPASAGLSNKQSHQDDEKSIVHRERGTTVAFAQPREDRFEIPTVQELLSREEDPALFNGFARSLCSSVSKVAVTAFSGGCDEDGCYHGSSCILETKGGMALGRVHHGFLHGRVEMQFPDSFKFEGMMQENQLTGEAVITHKCAQYRGEVVQGAAEGLGALVLDDETTYEGQWSGGLRHGTGILTFPGAQKHFYSGEWYADQKQGWGLMQYPSGSVYDGEWVDDLKHGFGTMYWTQRMERYRGGWSSNNPDGVGEHVWYKGAAGVKDTRAAVVRCNRYVGMMRDGHRHGEGTMHYASGAWFEGQWRQDCKHGEGVYVFEDNSVWFGTWENDRPVETSTHPFAASSACPKVYIQDLLHHEQNAAFAAKGVDHVLMCNNSELRALYDLYSQQDIPWLHNSDYHTCMEKRSSFGMLSMQFWLMLIDGCVLSSMLPLCKANRILKHCCNAPMAILERRNAVLNSPNYPGVWIFNLPDHSPYQEILYPEFCAAIVRIADVRFSAIQGLSERLKKLVMQHLLPLQLSYIQLPMYKLHADSTFVQYLQQMNPVLKIVFHAACRCVKVPNRDAPPDIDAAHAVATANVTNFQSTACGLTIIPDLTTVGAAIAPSPDDFLTHPLDITPMHACDSCTLSVRQFIFLLQQFGFVSADGTHDRCLSYAAAVAAIRRACSPAAKSSFMDSVPSAGAGVQASDVLLCGLKLTYLEFVMSCIAIATDMVTKDESTVAKVRAFIDGPRGFVSEVLRATKVTLPPELSDNFSYLTQGGTARGTKASLSTRRSRKSAGDSVISGTSSLQSAGKHSADETAPAP